MHARPGFDDEMGRPRTRKRREVADVQASDQRKCSPFGLVVRAPAPGAARFFRPFLHAVRCLLHSRRSGVPWADIYFETYSDPLAAAAPRPCHAQSLTRCARPTQSGGLQMLSLIHI